MTKYITFFGLSMILWMSCNDPAALPLTGPAQFQLLRQAETGLDFTNHLEQSTEFNVFASMYFFNGGGVAIGDINNDELPGWAGGSILYQ